MWIRGGDIQDLTANLYNCYKKGKVEASDGVAVAMTAIGAIPELGSALKGSMKIFLKAAQELASNKAGDAVAAVKKLMDVPMVRSGIEKFLQNAASFKQNAMQSINAAFDKIIKLKPDLAAFINEKRQALLSSVSNGIDSIKSSIENVKNRVMGREAQTAPAGHRMSDPNPQGVGVAGNEPQRFFKNGTMPTVREYSWGKAVVVDKIDVNMSAKNRALYIRDAMNVAGVDMVSLPIGSSSYIGMMSELQKLVGREYLLVRTYKMDPTGKRKEWGELVLVKGGKYDIAKLPFLNVPVAHTHPPHSLEKDLAEYAGMMASPGDIEELRAAGSIVGRIINGNNNSRQYFDFREMMNREKVSKRIKNLSKEGKQKLIDLIDERKKYYELSVKEFDDDDTKKISEYGPEYPGREVIGRELAGNRLLLMELKNFERFIMEE